MTEPLQHAGAEVFTQSVIEIIPPGDWHWSSPDLAIDALQDRSVDGITFSKRHRVKGFFQRLHQRNFDARLMAGTVIAAVGPATAAQPVPWGLRADVVPVTCKRHSAIGLLEALPESLSGRRWIVTSTNRSRDTIASGLQQARS
ncbi:MAG: uroporphyrinogen-III synthase [Pirellulaceae bacterium]